MVRIDVYDVHVSPPAVGFEIGIIEYLVVDDSLGGLRRDRSVADKTCCTFCLHSLILICL